MVPRVVLLRMCQIQAPAGNFFIRLKWLVRRWLWLGLAIFGGGDFVGAETLRTRNGDLLVGEVVLEDARGLRLRSPVYGEIWIWKNDIQSREPDVKPAPPAPKSPEDSSIQPIVPDTKSAPLPEAKTAGEPDEKSVAKPGVKTSADEDAHGWLARKLWKYNPLKEWDTTLNLGFVRSRGDDNENQLNIRFRTERKANGLEYLADIRYEYGEDVLANNQRVPTDDLLTGELRFRYNFQPRLFLQSNARYHRNTIKDIHHEGTQTVGLGWRFLETERWKGSVTPSVGAQYKEISQQQGHWSSTAGSYQDLEVKVMDGLKLRESIYYLIAPEDMEDYVFRGYVELINQLSASVQLNLRYDYSYDNQVGVASEEVQEKISLSIGLHF